jgi:hypothetical protein
VKKYFAHRPLPDFKSSQMCPRLSPPYLDGGGALADGEVRPGEANKRARSAIELTRGRLVTGARPGNGPVMAGGEVPGELGGKAKP